MKKLHNNNNNNNNSSSSSSSSSSNNNNNNNEFISAYPFYMKLVLRPKLYITKKKHNTIRYREIIS